MKTYRIEKAKLIERMQGRSSPGPSVHRLAVEQGEFVIVPASWNDYPDIDLEGGLTGKAVSHITAVRDRSDGWLEVDVSEHIMPKAGWDLIMLQMELNSLLRKFGAGG